jgi:hypothetical protein
MDYEKLALAVQKDIEKLEKKHGVKLGVWLSWRDLARNLDALKMNHDLEELNFGLQLRIETNGKESDDTTI